MRLLAISGSLRRDSLNTLLLDAASRTVPARVDVVRWCGLAEIPAFDEDVETVPDAVAALRAELARADAVLFATPEYNGSVPGALKNALDWVSRPAGRGALRDKPVAVIGASQGLFGAVWAQAELRKILGVMGARVDTRDLPVGRAQEAFSVDGRLADARLAATLEAIVLDLVLGAERRAAA
jgi:chromate reductase